jgi:hypothetical protein
MVPVGNPSVAASLETEIGLGADVSESTWALGDLFFQPLWLRWGIDPFDIRGAHGFYAPGKYDGAGHIGEGDSTRRNTPCIERTRVPY